MDSSLLEVLNITVAYGKKAVVHDVSFSLEEGSITVLLGPNGAGKTTILNSILGLTRARRGKIVWKGKEITSKDVTSNMMSGIGIVPQQDKIFSGLSVLNNLEMAGYILKGRGLEQRIDSVYTLFPILASRRGQMAGTLSGGERQMLALGMSLIPSPQLLLLDEPSLGLAPVIINQVMDRVRSINSELKTTILLVEQNIKEALAVAGRVIVIKLGTLVRQDKVENIKSLDELWELF